MRAVRTSLLALLALVAIGTYAMPVRAQEPDLVAGLLVDKLTAEPAEVIFTAGDRAPLSITALDAYGNRVEAQIRVSGRGISYSDGYVTGSDGGEFVLTASVVLPADAGRRPSEVPQLRIPVTVSFPAIARIAIQAEAGRLYAGTRVRHSAVAVHENSTIRPGATFTWSSSDPSVASVDAHGYVTAHAPGTVSISVEFEGVEGVARYQIPPFPASTIEIEGGLGQARTGDVLTFVAVARDENDETIDDLPVGWSVAFVPDDSINAPGAAGIVRGGKFVGEVPGVYTVVASTGNLTARRTVDIRPRDVVQDMEIMGQGSMSEYHTSDLWIFEGLDGRDYAVTGTWGGRRLGVLLGRDRPDEHREDRFHTGRRPHGERREGLTRRALRGPQP